MKTYLLSILLVIPFYFAESTPNIIIKSPSQQGSIRKKMEEGFLKNTIYVMKNARDCGKFIDYTVSPPPTNTVTQLKLKIDNRDVTAFITLKNGKQKTLHAKIKNLKYIPMGQDEVGRYRTEAFIELQNGQLIICEENNRSFLDLVQLEIYDNYVLQAIQPLDPTNHYFPQYR